MRKDSYNFIKDLIRPGRLMALLVAFAVCSALVAGGCRQQKLPEPTKAGVVGIWIAEFSGDKDDEFGEMLAAGIKEQLEGDRTLPVNRVKVKLRGGERAFKKAGEIAEQLNASVFVFGEKDRDGKNKIYAYLRKTASTLKSEPQVMPASVIELKLIDDIPALQPEETGDASALLKSAVYYQAGRWREAVAVLKTPAYKKTAPRSFIFLLANSYLHMARYAEIQKQYLEEARKVYPAVFEGKKDLLAGLALNNYCLVRDLLGNYDEKNLQLLKTAVDIISGKDEEYEARARYNYAGDMIRCAKIATDENRKKKLLHDAEKQLQATVKVWKKNNSLRELGAALVEAGNARAAYPGKNKENMERAIQLYNEALMYWKPDVYPLEAGMIYNNMGTAYKELSYGDREQNLQKAAEYYNRALELYSRKDNPLEKAQILESLAGVYEQTEGMQQKAYEAMKAAVPYIQKGAGTGELSMIYYRIGMMKAPSPGEEIALEDFNESVGNIKKAMDLALGAKDTDLYAKISLDLGLLYGRTPMPDNKNLDYAIAIFESAVQELNTREKSNLKAGLSHNLGSAYMARSKNGDLEKAAGAFQAALDSYEQNASSEEEAKTKRSLGFVFARLGYSEKALQELKDAMKSFPENKYPLEYAKTLHFIGIANASWQGDGKDEHLLLARKAYLGALKIYTRDQYPVQYEIISRDLERLGK